ncbi:MAG: hypothetical protein FIA99_12925 [Ruminiclostridium sp.]|nr:hypothetical protein [Ruminiclostridium sp.]
MKEFHIKTRDGIVQVSEDVYKAYYKHKWNEEYNNKKRLVKELSYEDLRDNGVPVELIMMDASRTLEDEVISRIMVQKLRKCMSGLSSYERFLITEIYFKDRSIREISDMLSIPKSSVQRQKAIILKKLFDLFEKNE